MVKQYGTPGPRAIYPEMCDSPSLGRCGVLANALFPRLIAQADDQGRLAGDAHDVALTCLPKMLRAITISDVEDALVQLEAAAMLQRYEVRGERYVQLVQWWRWQASQRRAYPSRWPAPKGWQDLVYGSSKADPETFEQAVSDSSPRNAAIRGISPRVAASRAGPHAGPRTGPRARAMPGPAVPLPVPPARAAGANGAAAGGLRESAQAILDDPATSAEAKAGAQAVLDMRVGR